MCSTNIGFSVGSACVRLILVLVGGRQTAIVVARYDSMISGTHYVPDTYVPGISRQKSIRTYVMFLFLFQHGTPTFSVTKVLGICVRSFIRREKENPPEILYTKKEIPQGAS